MKKILLTLFALVAVFTASAQRTTKLDLDLLQLAQPQSSMAKQATTRERQSDTPKTISVVGVLKEGVTLPEAELKALGIIVEDNTYGIVDMRVPADKLLALDSLSAFRSFSTPKVSKLMNQKSREAEKVDVVQNQALATQEGLPQTYTGEGVIVGVFDSGIDYNHANFRDPETKQTRIREAIIFRNYILGKDGDLCDADSNVVSAAQVMEFYDNAAEIDTLTTDNIGKSHGTHTSGTAAGSYNGDYLGKGGILTYTGQRGAAYKADLVLAGAGSLLSTQFQRLSVARMDSIATSEGKPLVISLSIGSNADWLDGKCESNLFYDRFTDHGNRPGRIVCVSASNEGKGSFAIYRQLDADNDYTVRTFLPKTDDEGQIYKVTIFNSDSTDLDVSAVLVDTLKNEVVQNFDAEEFPKQVFYTDARAEDHDNRYNGKLYYKLVDSEENQNICPALIVKSKDRNPCKVRMFMTDSEYNLHSFYDYGREGYTAGDNKSSISIMACSESVLSVGAWSANDKSRWYTEPTDTLSSPSIDDKHPLSDICSFSSFVETDDNGLSHPDFAAPGLDIASGLNAYDQNHYDADGTYSSFGLAGVAKEENGRTDGKQSLLGAMSGTSMSTPNAAGIIALWLQANPELTVNQIREVIKATADKDEFTAASPARFGAGKINALAGLKYILEKYPTGIQEVKDIEKPTIQKMMQNGQFIILKNGIRYNAAGQQL